MPSPGFIATCVSSLEETGRLSIQVAQGSVQRLWASQHRLEQLTVEELTLNPAFFDIDHLLRAQFCLSKTRSDVDSLYSPQRKCEKKKGNRAERGVMRLPRQAYLTYSSATRNVAGCWPTAR